ncbi:MAG: COR domain-containing protein [Saprospiraceae bacterium]
MDKPAFIAELETALDFPLNNLTGQEALWKVIEHLAFIDACMAGRESATAADLERAALERLNMSVCRNCYLCDAHGAVIGLNLFGNDLAQLPVPEHPGWRRLRVLHLAENKLTELALPAGWQALQSLDLGDNQTLRALRFDGPLPTLERLDASDSGLEHLVVPAGMAALKHLDVSRNKLQSVVFEGDCVALEWLDFSGNWLTTFALSGRFDQLQHLYLTNNKLALLDFTYPLRNLQTLHLSGNKLTNLPEDLLSFTSLESLYLHKNEWTGNLASVAPSKEYANAFVPVRDYLRELSKGTIENDRVKIIIVGNGRTGKTSMFRRLKGLPYREDEKFTHGVDLGELIKKNLPKVKTKRLQANVWDFGGQHIFYATHQFFLTDDALYILAWTAEQNVLPHRERDKGKLPIDEKWRSNEYWLENIRLHAPKSPVLMVQTHYDCYREPYDQTAFAAEPFRADCLKFAASNDEGLETLKNQITQSLNDAIPTFGENYPETYDAVIGQVEMKKAQNKISRAEFDAICREAKITAGGETSVLEFLRAVGAVVWFDGVKALSGTVFINPDWLTEQVYRLINNDLIERNGRFDQKYLEEKLKGFTPIERMQFLELLKKFELIFETEEDGPPTFISPQYLPDTLEPATQSAYQIILDDLTWEFKFRFPRFVPENVMVNFLSRYGPFSRKMYWKNGICFSTAERAKCIVNFDEERSTLHVFTQPDVAGAHLQAEVCRAFVELSKNANAEISIDGNCFVSWQGLKEAVDGGINKIKTSCKGTDPVPVSDFNRFFGKELPGEAPGREERLPVIFFSYAWGINDQTGENREEIVEQLYDSLAADGKYELKRDKKDNGYRKSIREFMKQIGRGEFVVTVISDKYLKSPNCMFELLEIFRKSNSEPAEFREKIFPVVLNDAKLYDPLDRLDYVEFWMEKCRKLEEKINKVGLANAKAAIPDFDIYDEIMKNVGLLGGILADLNTLSPQMLSADNFAEVKNAIDERASNQMQHP